ncbi:uncharacterized protein [Rutidosis leptorrhynchoides]|uniref:uncharacterized protein n=1 Tax=Rutidosis leptorrhynchoides TaxID=125765 RepID=UPI003A9973B5
MARSGVNFSCDNRHKCKKCCKKANSKNKKQASKGNSGSFEGGRSINNILSLNIRGFGVKGKFGWVKDYCRKERPDIATFQETKCKGLKDSWVHALWGSSNCGFVQLDAVTLLIWDLDSFVADKRRLICGIRTIDSAWMLCGDFNEVRFQADRLNCVFHHSRATRFNDFIARNNLIEIPINGKKFTRVSDDGIKFSKLDRVLVNDKYLKLWKDLSVIALERMDSDHCPLLLRDQIIDFGLKPFKCFDEWLKNDGVEKVIQDAWSKSVTSSKKDRLFRDKLKNVKKDLRAWSKNEFGDLESEIKGLKEKATSLEALAKSGAISDDDRKCWLETRRNWIEKEKIKSGKMKQKARIWWNLEGNENSKYFHASIRRKYNKCNIRGLNINGVWVEDPRVVKEMVLEYFRN